MFRSHRVLVALSCLLACGRIEAQTPHLPAIVDRGLKAYRSGGADAAVHAWLTNSPIAHDSGAVGSVAALRQIEQAYGPMVGYEVLKVSPIGSHLLKVYLMILYQRGPLYMWFECYETGSEWLVSAFLFNPRPEAILPPSLLDH